ncbi:PAAR-like domain-containing protein [uncultured Roseibium sp.]|uniref:PAAR-like domain-containing protein n=1 Tax=uncultured Roseibium sp. TaxID=1936171 RepID=UPI002634009F|nr:PAAR-like domain-containing protein [uncultured Roseibium sp.]
MCFLNSQGPLPGMDFAAPDVYLQTTPVGPVPVPLVSIGMRASEIPTAFKFLVMCMPSHNMTNNAPVTISGPGPGVASGMVCSSSRNMKGSTKLMVGPMPATRSLLDPTMQNGMTPNSVGTTLVPSQIKVISLA